MHRLAEPGQHFVDTNLGHNLQAEDLSQVSLLQFTRPVMKGPVAGGAAHEPSVCSVETRSAYVAALVGCSESVLERPYGLYYKPSLMVEGNEEQNLSCDQKYL